MWMPIPTAGRPRAISFAIALKRPLEEARETMEKAGFTFSHANKFDIIVEYFITHGNCNIFEINEAPFAFDQSLLGGILVFVSSCTGGHGHEQAGDLRAPQRQKYLA